jgi:hypothetical protein
MTGRSWCVLALLVTAVVVSPTAAKKKVPPPCSTGRYVLAPIDSNLIFGQGTPTTDAFTVATTTLSIPPCGQTKAKLKGTAAGTVVKATWKKCGTLKKVVTTATIAPGCATMQGTIKAKKVAAAAFTASLSTGCGDGIVDPGLGEECEDDAGCAAGEECRACACVATPTTTTTVIVGATTTTPSSTTTTTVTVCQATTTTTDAGICGDGIIDPGETCDDGSDTGSVGDPCPAGCVIESCTAVPGSARKFDVTFAPPAGQQIAGITVAVDYPDGRVSIPDTSVAASITKLPLGHSSTPTDLDWELLEAIAGPSAITPGRLFEITFQDCACAAPPTGGDFTCLVVDASDPLGNPVAPDTITCSVAAAP